jgi:hypothetical protein
MKLNALASVLLILSSTYCYAGDLSPKEKRLRALVDLLASKNSAPVSDQIPETYDRNAQATVYLVVHQLLAEGTAGIDVLAEHLGDKRYSLTEEAPDDYYNRTVGDVCARIMYRCIRCYENEISLITYKQFFIGKGSLDNLAQWWKVNRTRPLWKIQVEEIDDAIKFMNAVDGRTATPPYPEGRRIPFEEFEKLRKENLQILKDLRETITARKEPYRPKTLNGSYKVMVGLPWPTGIEGSGGKEP